MTGFCINPFTILLIAPKGIEIILIKETEKIKQVLLIAPKGIEMSVNDFYWQSDSFF